MPSRQCRRRFCLGASSDLLARADSGLPETWGSDGLGIVLLKSNRGTWAHRDWVLTEGKWYRKKLYFLFTSA